MPRDRSKPAFHVASGVPEGGRSEEDFGKRERPLQERSPEAGGRESVPVSRGLREGRGRGSRRGPGDAAQKMKAWLERPGRLLSTGHGFSLLLAVAGGAFDLSSLSSPPGEKLPAFIFLSASDCTLHSLTLAFPIVQ